MLGSIQTPTLVVTADAYTAAAAENDGLTTYLVEHIPGARLLALHGQDFVPFGGDCPLVIWVGVHPGIVADD